MKRVIIGGTQRDQQLEYLSYDRNMLHSFVVAPFSAIQRNVNS